jgi:predicted DNA-binding protein
MAKRQISLRISDVGKQKLDLLSKRYGTATTAVEVALDRLYMADQRIAFDVTEYDDGRGNRAPAIYVRWSEIEAVLGRPHEGSPEDDDLIIELLLGQGAPDWIKDAEGWVDEDGWGVYRPSGC